MKFLNNITKKMIISSGGTTTVTVSENWFATTVAFSFMNSGRRYITYANNLNASSLSMSIEHSIV